MFSVARGPARNTGRVIRTEDCNVRSDNRYAAMVVGVLRVVPSVPGVRMTGGSLRTTKIEVRPVERSSDEWCQ